MKTRKVLLALPLILAACATTSGYVDSTADDAATLSGAHVRTGLLDWYSCYPRQVDGKHVADSFFKSKWNRTAKLDPGPHKIFVKCTFNTGSIVGLSDAIIPIDFNFPAGGHYSLQAKLDESSDEYEIKIIDVKSGQPTGTSAEAPYSAVEDSFNSGLIFIPSKK